MRGVRHPLTPALSRHAAKHRAEEREKQEKTPVFQPLCFFPKIGYIKEVSRKADYDDKRAVK